MAGSDRQRGFSLVELLVIIVVIGILAAIAMQSMTASVEDLKRIKTEREMEMLSHGIVGDPSLSQNGQRSDFGYVGDVGAFPPNLRALYQNPGGLATWSGPYIPMTFTQDTIGYRTDEWGRAYAYSGGTTITSTGSGATITKKIADATSDYLRNRVTGAITDAAGSAPGATYADSINLVVTFPNGTGGLATKTYHPNSGGNFTLDSLPVGTLSLRVVFTPDADTLQRYITVMPRNRSEVSYEFALAFAGGGTSENMVLRPNGAGSATELTRTGCSANYECVQEVTPDDGASCVIRADNSFASDVYALANPSTTTGTIQSVKVWCRARREHSQGQVQLAVYTNGSEYRGATQDLTSSFADYSQTWLTNPAGGPWTWADITSLQAGVRLRGQNSGFPAYCTQVWVEVEYRN